MSEETFDITSENIENQIPTKKRNFWAMFFIIFFKLLYFGIGTYIAKLLYQKWGTNNCNYIVTIFFSILSLAFFEAAGIPVSKLADIKFFK